MLRLTATVVAVVGLLLGTAVPASAAGTAAGSAAPASTGAVAAAAGGPVATSLAGFNPGNIISDAVFTDKNTMTEAQIQAFFNSKVGACRSGYTCLKNFRADSVNRPADTYCKGYTGARGESAARIIHRVSQACGINPRVLIVMLQKEQGLITHTWPSQWRYDIALGQACPDTAPCDPKFVGFFHQIYGAARQMNVYMEGRYFQWYKAGRTWQIQYHPDRNRCGTGPVYIANRATEALYYYTPYQPNAAAMRAGFGEGDSCSAYGNRNFYNYFTDWFGSTQSGGSVGRPAQAAQGLAKVGSTVWLLTGTNRYHVSAAAYPEYKQTLGSPSAASAADLAEFKEAGVADVYVKNAATGEVALIQGGQTHRFASCALVSQWGGACGAPLVVLSSAHFDRFGTGAAMTPFGRLTPGGRIHQVVGASLIPLFDSAVAARRNGGTVPYAAVLPGSAVSGKKIDAYTRFLPGTFVKASTAPEVWLPDESGRLHHLPSWAHAAELGLPSRVGSTVKATDLDGYAKGAALGSFVRCGAQQYVAAGGVLRPWAGRLPDGFTNVELGASECAALKLSGSPVAGRAVFVRFGGTGAIHHLVDGQYRAVDDAAQRRELNGGSEPTVLSVGAALAKSVRIGAAYPRPGTFILVKGAPEVWLVDGGSLVHLPSWEMAAEYGLRRAHAVVDAAAVKGMEKRPSLRPFASCDGRTYAAAGGALRAVADTRLGGNDVTRLSGSVCAGRTSGSAMDAPVFLGDGSRTAVAVGGGFLRLPDEASVTRAAAGAKVLVYKVGRAYLDRLPAADVPGEGALVRASNEPTVTFIDGSIRRRLPNWGVAADLGIQSRYAIVAPASVASRAVGGTELSIFVTCNAKSYVASQGRLVPVTAKALGGFAPVALSAASCRSLPLQAGTALDAFALSAPGGATYAPSGGRLTTATPAAGVAVLPVDARTLAGMPKR